MSLDTREFSEFKTSLVDELDADSAQELAVRIKDLIDVNMDIAQVQAGRVNDRMPRGDDSYRDLTKDYEMLSGPEVFPVTRRDFFRFATSIGKTASSAGVYWNAAVNREIRSDTDVLPRALLAYEPGWGGLDANPGTAIIDLCGMKTYLAWLNGRKPGKFLYQPFTEAKRAVWSQFILFVESVIDRELPITEGHKALLESISSVRSKLQAPQLPAAKDLLKAETRVNASEETLRGISSRSYTHWKCQIEGSDEPPRPVLFFLESPPQEFIESGLYVCYTDFLNVRRSAQIADEPLAGFYHSIVLYLLEGDPRIYSIALNHLRYNPHNHSAWNNDSWTHKYYISTQVLADYAAAGNNPEFKIPGVGVKGRRIMRAVLEQDDTIEDKLAAERARFE